MVDWDCFCSDDASALPEPGSSTSAADEANERCGEDVGMDECGEGNDAATAGDRIGVSLRSGSFAAELPPPALETSVEPPIRIGVVAAAGVEDANFSGSSGARDGDRDGSGDEDENDSGRATGIGLPAGALPALLEATSEENSSGDADEEAAELDEKETAGGEDACTRALCMAAARSASCSFCSSSR